MFGLQKVSPSLLRVVLPPPAGVPMPYGSPYNVWVVLGERPVVVDTGWQGVRSNLLAALEEAGVNRFEVSHVLLTGLGPAQTGNSDAFPNAMLVGRDPDGISRSYRRAMRTEQAHEVSWIRAIGSWGQAASEWSSADVEAFAQSWMGQLPETLSLLGVQEGMRIRTGAGVFTVYESPGVGWAGTTWLGDNGLMFGGELIDLDEEPMLRDAPAAVESLMRISQTAPQLLLPAHGAPMRSHVRAFRSLNLFVNNLMSNIQYALDGPRSIAEIRSRDLGYVPRDLIRFAGSARMAYAVLEELHRVGVAVREGEGPTGTFHIQRPSRL
jgi:hypothetical protein